MSLKSMLTPEVLLFNDAAGLIVGPVMLNILPEKTHFAVNLACKETGNAILRELAFVKVVKIRLGDGFHLN